MIELLLFLHIAPNCNQQAEFKIDEMILTGLNQHSDLSVTIYQFAVTSYFAT